MGKYYHITSLDNLESILKSGLKPSGGPGIGNPEDAPDYGSKVHLFRTLKETKEFKSFLEEPDLTILSISLPKDWKIHKEESFGYPSIWFTSRKTIPAKYIEVRGGS